MFNLYKREIEVHQQNEDIAIWMKSIRLFVRIGGYGYKF